MKYQVGVRKIVKSLGRTLSSKCKIDGKNLVVDKIYVDKIKEQHLMKSKYFYSFYIDVKDHTLKKVHK